ncbi:unnamed protein product [Dracunculus medinensis]|uniref:DNA repair protein REV1 n=1 Tax=Dracunculus medinensis TaxID=318479 RepID=A0A0N4UKV2_DRAME|nr:unnamed protein product [Dracunculus medinensis]
MVTQYGTTTYTVATHVANSKISKLRKNEKIIHPRWVTESIEVGHKLDEKNYLLFQNGSVLKNSASKWNRRSENAPNAANDPDFIKNFYERSRLHLISTLAQDMKLFVNDLRTKSNNEFPSRNRLLHLATTEFTNIPSETICHLDMDCFFVSVALISRPDLIGKPVAITHSRGVNESAGMSEVASCSYEARLCGVRNGCFVRDAKLRCPNLTCLPYQFDEYRRLSKLIYTIITRYTNDIRAVSCDEMYIDLRSFCLETGVLDVNAIVSTIREEIFEETKCHASVGIGSSMLLARLATRHAKPNGQFMVKQSEINDFIKNERISSLPGIGYSIQARIKESYGNMQTCEDLQKIPLNQLQELFGKKTGAQIYNFCRGIDCDRNFFEYSERKSVSCDINYGIRFKEEEELTKFLLSIALELEKKLDVIGVLASAVTIRLLIRSSDAPEEPEKFMGHGLCNVVTRSSLFSKPTSSASLIMEESKKIIKVLNPVISDLRGIGVQLTKLAKNSDIQKGNKGEFTLTQYFNVRSRKSLMRDLSKKKTVHFKEAARKGGSINKEPKYTIENASISGKQYYGFGSCNIYSKSVQIFESPKESEIAPLISFFYYQLKNGHISNVTGIFKFLERKALQQSLEWIVICLIVCNI